MLIETCRKEDLKNMKTKKPPAIINEQDKNEIAELKKELQNHLQKYATFKSFTKVCKDALQVADALLNDDIKTFKKYAIKFTKHTAEKMQGMQSLSTYKKTSSICKYLTACGCGICSKCYAEKSLSLYETTLKPSLIYNTLLMKYIELDQSQIPYINNKYFRFEAFSDIQSSKHFKNLIKVCNKNKNTIFTLWTKAGYTLVNMMEKEKIKKLPNNLNIVFSEYYVNKPTDHEYIKQLQKCLYPSQAIKDNYKNALKVFIVYDDEKKRINSGFYQCENSCINCLKCYKKSKNIIYIAEKIH